MSINNDVIILSFYGDKERKYNLPELLSYPNKVKYYRSFTYQEKYASEILRNKINENPEYFNNKDGILCMKIENGKITIPIWKIKILNCKIEERTYIFNFILEQLINHINHENLEDFSNLFEINEWLAEICDNSIFDDISITTHKDLWVDIIDKLSKTHLKGLEFCKNTLFYRLVKIEKYRGLFSRYLTKKDRGKEKVILSPRMINKEGKYAYQLSPGMHYNIRIFHKIVMANDNQKLKDIYPINLEGPFKLHSSTLTQEINSKYRDHLFSVITTDEKSAIQEIRFNSPKYMKIFDSGKPDQDIDIFFRDVRIPISFKYTIKTKILNIWLPLGLFFMGILMTSIATMNKCLIFSVIGGFIQTISLLKLRKSL